MVGAVREHDLVSARVAHCVAEVVDDRAHALLRVVGRGQAREVVVVRQHLARDHLGRACVPAKQDADVFDLVTQAAREEERTDAEAGEDLRQLRRMAEAVGEIARTARLDAEAAADPPPEQEVADE